MLHEVEEMTKKKVSIKKKVAKKVPEEIIEKAVKEEIVPVELSTPEKEEEKPKKKAGKKKKPAKKEEVVKRAIRKEVAHGKKSNLTLVYIGLVVLVIAVLMLLAAQEKPLEKLPTAGEYVKLNMPTSYEPGKVKILEFLKFDCPHCYALNPQLPALKKKYGDNLSITYKPMLWRSVPQDQAFRKSIEAYILAERMGKDEEMKDALFKAMFVDKKDLSSELVLGDIAKSVGLGEDFSAALKKGDARDEAEANIRLAESFQVDETPTIIINGNLKVTPALMNEDMTAMAGNIDTIIASLLS